MAVIFKGESDAPPPRREGNRGEDGRIGNAAAKTGGGDQGEKRKRGSSESPPLGGSRRGGNSSQAHHQRDRGWRERGGGDFRSLKHAHDRSSYHPTTTSTEKAAPLRRGRDDSPSSMDSRERETVAGHRTYNNRARGQQQWSRCDSEPRRRDARRERVERGGSGDDFRGRGDRRREIIDGAEEGERERGGGGGGGDLPDLYSVQQGTVHSVRPFGIFVRMNNYRNHGLVHLSQISNHEVTNRSDSDAAKVEAISAIVGEGDHVWVKVISVKTEDDGNVKVGCSLKYVSQGDGRDLDPNNLLLEKLQSKSSAWQASKKLELDAVYNVVCTRCGGHGHMKKDCYSTGEKTYALLKDEGDDEDSNREQERGGGRREGRGGAGAGSSSSKSAAGVAKNSIVGGPSLRPPSGPRGRGRAMVQPAWMKHGVEPGPGVSVGGGNIEQQEKGGAPAAPESFPEKVTTVQEAIAILGKAKEDKRRRRDERRQHRRHSSSSSKREKRHGGKEGRREKHKKRRGGGGGPDHGDGDHHHQKSRKRHRT